MGVDQTQYRLLQVNQGVKVEVGRLIDDDLVIGRDPEPAGIFVDSQAVSRNHGLFSFFSGHWFFRDLGSTNRSWLNGVILPEEQWRVIRADSCLQIADVKIVFEEISGTTISAATQTSAAKGLLVFEGDQFLREYQIPEFGRALVVGGHQGHLEIKGELVDLPSLVIEKRGLDLVAAPVARELPLFYNDQELSEQILLKDGDCLRISDYLILFNDPPMVTSSSVKELGLYSDGEEPASSATDISQWTGSNQEQRGLSDNEGLKDSFTDDFISAEKTPISRVFGQPLDEQDELSDQTTTIDPASLQDAVKSFERHPSMRYNMSEAEDQKPRATLEDRLIVVALAGVLLVLIIFALWLGLSGILGGGR